MVRMASRALGVVVALTVLAGCDGAGDEPTADPRPSGSPTSASSPGSTPTGSTPTASTPTDPGPVVECPKNIVEIDPDLPDAVPEGATSVRLCAGEPGEVAPPVDALTAGAGAGDVDGDVDAVGSVVAAVNDQRLVTRGCADRQLPAYQLAFGYPDGSSFVVAGRFTACGELLVGSARRADAMPALNRFVELLLAQREGSTPPDLDLDASDIGCDEPPARWVWRLGRPVDLRLAVLCYGDPDHPDRAHRVVVRPDDLRVLVASMRRDRVSTAGALGCTYFARNDHWIVGFTAWGDPVVMRRGCGGLAVAPDHDWAPRGEARRILRDLLARAR